MSQNYTIVNGELYHYGIKGQKWGRRRYQNPDGSLTPEGKKRYGTMSPDKLQKALKKQVRQVRAEQTDWSRQWQWNNTIGPNSKAALDKFLSDKRAYDNSEPVKAANKKLRDLDRRAEEGRIDPDEYSRQYESTLRSVYKPEFDSSVAFTSSGRRYSQAYLDTYGNDITIGYLKDLGYADQVAKDFAKRISKASIKRIE